MTVKVKAAVTFKTFATSVAKRVELLSKGELYTVDVSKEDLWAFYLSAFPEGSNPMFRERTEHDCQCCRNFIVNLGAVVSLKNGEVSTVWDNLELTGPYDTVARKMGDFLRTKKINGVFRTKESSYGASSTWEHKPGQESRQWDHFHGAVGRKHHTTKPDESRGNVSTTVDVFYRGLSELSVDALNEVISLIESDSLYRGPEFLESVKQFKNLKADWSKLSLIKRHNFMWESYSNPVSRFKNTVIGTLVEDLSSGADVETAVRMFESKVAPTNYKRPKSLITPKMINDAIAKVEELGLSNALQRRFAKISDVSVNNVLFVDNSVRSQMKDNMLAELLMSEVKPEKVSLDKAKSIDIEEFLAEIVPTAKSISALVTGDMMGNFVSLTAPAIENSGRLLKWSNDFAWSYYGNITDSIKQRVKRAGGKVDAALRVSLSWFNSDDLDIHVIEPNRNHIYYFNKDGKLDVDMNAGNIVKDPVENVTWSNRNLKNGEYQVYINNYNCRESINVGFLVQMEFDGVTHTFQYDKPIVSQVPVVDFTVKDGKVVYKKLRNNIKETSEFRDKWGVSVGSLCKVDSIMLSPNHWDNNSVGNKHWFFILHGCKNPEPTRGLYNEFLNSALEPHRKVFEVLGDKMKCPCSDEQLSGVGFSSTLEHELPVVVQMTKGSRAYKIKF
jgi:hypothetical protein